MENFDFYLGKANMASVNFSRKSLKLFKELNKYLDMNNLANNSLSPDALRKLNIHSEGEMLLYIAELLPPQECLWDRCFFFYLP